MKTPVRRSALYHRLVAAGARMAVDGPWEIAQSFADGGMGEQSLRRGVGIADGSARYFRLVCGSDLPAWLPAAPAVGLVAPIVVEGHRALCCRLTDDRALLASGAVLELPAPPGPCAHQVDLTSGTTRILLGGPESLTLLRAVTSLNVGRSGFPDGRCAQTSLARVPATLIHRDRGDLPAYEILVARDVGVYVWEVLLDAGTPLEAVVVPATAFGPEV